MLFIIFSTAASFQLIGCKQEYQQYRHRTEEERSYATCGTQCQKKNATEDVGACVGSGGKRSLVWMNGWEKKTENGAWVLCWHPSSLLWMLYLVCSANCVVFTPDGGTTECGCGPLPHTRLLSCVCVLCIFELCCLFCQEGSDGSTKMPRFCVRGLVCVDRWEENNDKEQRDKNEG